MKKKNKLSNNKKHKNGSQMKNNHENAADEQMTVNYETMGFYNGREPKVTKQPKKDVEDI